MTLALAVAGGISALIIKLVLHNSDKAKTKVSLNWSPLLLVALIVEGVSVLCAVIARATITATAPIVYKVNFADVQNWSEASYEGASAIEGFAGAQFLLFVLGLAAVCVFILKNSNVDVQ